MEILKDLLVELGLITGIVLILSGLIMLAEYYPIAGLILLAPICAIVIGKEFRDAF